MRRRRERSYERELIDSMRERRVDDIRVALLLIERLLEDVTLPGGDRAYLMAWVDEVAPKSPSAAAPKKKKPIPARLRWQVFKRDGFKCKHCGADEDLAADHIFPESKGGEATMDNLQTLCRPCNSRKHARIPDEAASA